MPPIPPKGSVDARFASNRFVEIIPGNLNEPKEIPLSLQLGDEPIKLTWTMKEQTGLRYFLLEKEESKIVAKHHLTH